MSARPNFTTVDLRDDSELVVNGRSDPEAPDDLLDIRVTLVQGERNATVSVGMPPSDWDVVFAVSDAKSKGGPFQSGPVTAFGVETRSTNMTTTTWAQTLTIPAFPDE